MDFDSIVFRPCQPKDLDAAIPLIYASGPDVCEYLFKDIQKGDAHQFLQYAFLKPGGESGYTNHICCEYESKVIGIGAIWSGRDSFRFLLSDIWKILSYYGPIKGINVLLRGLRSEKLIRPPKKREYCVGHLGINPDFRGIGVGTKLIHHLLQSIDIKNGEKVILDVSFINPKAKKLYEQLGFKVTQKRESNLERKAVGIIVPGHYRMEWNNLPQRI